MPSRRLALVLAALLAAAAAPQPSAGAVQPEDEQPVALWRRYEALWPSAQLIPTVLQWRGQDHEHEVLYQVPPSPRGTLFVAHGCAHHARDWWPPSDACPQCLGLPEELGQTQQALARGYAVLAMSANNSRGDLCMDFNDNHRDAAQLITSFRAQHGLSALPLYGLGVSVGGGFVLKLPQYIKFDGILSEVLGPNPLTFQPHTFKHGMPPTVFISMDEDPPMAYRISRDAALLRRLGVPVATVRVGQRAVGPTFFSDRSSRVPPAVSARVTAALRTLGMLDERGLVTMDPRHTKGPWVSQLLALVPELRGGGMVADHSQVWEELNLAYACHEIIGDFTTAALVWFESGGAADFEAVFQQHAVPGSGVVGDAAGALPPGWAPPEDAGDGRKAALAAKKARHAAQRAQHAQQEQQEQLVERPPRQPYEEHEAAEEDEEAAAAALKAQVLLGTEGAGDGASPLQLGAGSSSSGESSQQQQLEQQAGSLVSESSLQEQAAAATAPSALAAAGVPAAELDTGSAHRRPAVGHTAIAVGTVCGALVAVAAGLVAYRIRQLRRSGFSALPGSERGRRPHEPLAPIPEGPEGPDYSVTSADV